MGAGLNDVVIRLRADLSQYTRGMADGAHSVERLGDAAKATGLKIAMIGGGLGAATIASAKSFAEFASGLNKIVGLVGVSREQINAWKHDIVEIGAEVGMGPAKLTDALYYITSAGMRGAKALEVLRASAQASAAGLGDMGEIANAVTSAVNAYGASNLSAERAVGVLVATIREGKMRAEELAPTLGRVLVVAESLGVSFNQVGAAIASMTRTGLSSNQAVTALVAIMKTLNQGGAGTQKALAAAGLSLEGLRQTIKKPGGILTALVEIEAAFDRMGSSDNGNQLGLVFNNYRALTGALSMSGRGLAEAQRIFAEIGKEEGGALAHAFKETEGAGRNYARAQVELNRVSEEFGAMVLPKISRILVTVTTAMKGVTAQIGQLTPAAQDSIGSVAVWGPAFVLGAGLVTTAVSKMIGWIGKLIIAGKAMATFFTTGTTLVAGLATAVFALSYKLTELYLKSSGLGKNITAALGLASGSADAEVAKALAADDEKRQAWLQMLRKRSTKEGRAYTFEDTSDPTKLQAYMVIERQLRDLAQERMQAEVQVTAEHAKQMAAAKTHVVAMTPDLAKATMGEALDKIQSGLLSPVETASQIDALKKIAAAYVNLVAKEGDLAKTKEASLEATKAVREAEKVAADQQLDSLHEQLSMQEKMIEASDSLGAAGRSVREYERIADLMVKMTRATLGDAAATKVQVDLAGRLYEAQDKILQAKAKGVALTEKEKEDNAIVQAQLERESGRLAEEMVRGLARRQMEIERAFEEASKAAGRIMGEGVTNGIVRAMSGQKFGDAWGGIADSMSELLSDRLNAMFRAATTSGATKQTVLQAGGFWDPSANGGKGGISWNGVAAAGGQMVGGYLFNRGQQESNRGMATVGGALSGAVSGATTGSMGGWNWIGAAIGAVIGGATAYFSSQGPERLSYRYTVSGNTAGARAYTQGSEKEQNWEAGAQLVDRFNEVSTSFRQLLFDMKQPIEPLKTGIFQWSGKNGDPNTVFSAILKGDLPRQMAARYEETLTAGMVAGLGVTKERAEQEFGKLFEGDFDKALSGLKRYVAAMVALGDLKTELGKTLEDTKSELARGMMETFGVAVDKTMEKIGRLSQGLGSLTSDEQIARGEEIVALANQQLSANRQAIQDLELLRANVTAAITGLMSGLEEDAVRAAGPTEFAEFALRKFGKALEDLASPDLKPETLAKSVEELVKWGNELRNLRAELIAQSEAWAVFGKTVTDLLTEVATPLADVIAKRGLTGRGQFEAGNEQTINDLKKLQSEINSTFGPPAIALVTQMRDAIRTQYAENLRYLDDVIAAQEAMRNSYESFWQNINEQEATKQGDAAAANYYVGMMREAAGHLSGPNAETDPTKIAYWEAQMQAWATKLYALQDKVMLDVDGVVMTVLDFLKIVMPQFEAKGEGDVAMQETAVEAANRALAASLVGLGETVDAEKTRLGEALAAVGDALAELGPALEGTNLAIDGFETKINDASEALYAAVFGAGGINETLIAATTELNNFGGALEDDSGKGGVIGKTRKFAEALDHAASGLETFADQLREGPGQEAGGPGGDVNVSIKTNTGQQATRRVA